MSAIGQAYANEARGRRRAILRAVANSRGFYAMRNIGFTILLLGLSNIFMTFAWYAHLKELNQRPWIVAALVSWGIAFFEYMLQVPGNRIGYTVLSVGQLKLLQEVITLVVFVPFAVYYLKEPLKLDYLWAALCILGAVYFVFRSRLPACLRSSCGAQLLSARARGSRYAESKFARFGMTTFGNVVASITASCVDHAVQREQIRGDAHTSRRPSASAACTYGIARRT